MNGPGCGCVTEQQTDGLYVFPLSLPQMVIRFFNIRDSLRLCEEFSPVHYYYIFWLTPLGGKQSETILMRLLLPPLPPPPV